MDFIYAASTSSFSLAVAMRVVRVGPLVSGLGGSWGGGGGVHREGDCGGGRLYPTTEILRGILWIEQREMNRTSS
jgi:hypothetical protein